MKQRKHQSNNVLQRIIPRWRWKVSALAIMVSALIASGCGDRSASDAETRQPSPTRQPPAEPETTSPEIDTRAAGQAEIQRLVRAGADVEANKAIGSHLLRFPNDTSVMGLAAEYYQSRGQLDQALTMLDAAAESSGDDEPALRLRAAIWQSDAREHQQAIERLVALLEDHPSFDEARHELILQLNRRGFRFDANEQVRGLCRRGKARPEELRGLVFPTRSVTGLDAKPNVDDIEWIRRNGALNVARAMYSEGDVTDASVVLRNSQLVRDKQPAATAFYGQTLIDSQQFDAFRQWLDHVDRDSQRYPAYWMAVGGWAMHQRHFDVAARHFAEAILREPGDLGAYDRMTQALAASGRQEQSERFRQRGVLIDRLMAVTREVFVTAQVEPRAIEEMSRLLTDAGRPGEALAWYRIVLEKMGSPKQAIEKLDEALAMLDDQEFQRSSQSNLLCGLELDGLPSPLDLAEIRSENRVMIKSRPKPISAKTLEPSFVNVASKVGLDFTYFNGEVQVAHELRLFEQFGAGVACFDYDLDGCVDLYVGQAASEPPQGRGSRPNLMARSLGNRFIDVTGPARCDDRGYTCGITSGDWNQDGFPDLVVGNLARNTLFLNQGDGTFTIQHGDSVWNQPLNTTSLAMADVNGDHLPDLVEVNYVDDDSIYDPIQYKPDGTPVQLPAPLDFRPSEDRLFLARGDGTFVGQRMDPSQQVDPATGLGVVVTNLDDDAGNEIFVANDHLANHLWERQTEQNSIENQWQNTAALRGVALGAGGTPLGSMGIAVSDFDENGFLDLHVTNFENEWSNQYMQDAGGFFDDLVVAYRLDQPTYKMLGFGVQALDYDNNSVTDLVIGNGHVDDYTARGAAFEMPTQMFAIEDSRFVPKTVAGDPAYWDTGHLSRALATCDWNNDGRTDFVVTDLSGPLALLENRTETPYHWLQLQLVGTNAERDAIGATVKLAFAGRTITQVVQTGDGYMCKNQSLLAFGLGEHRFAERLEIHWPDSSVQTFTDLAADRRWLLIQDQAAPFELRH